MRRKGDGSVRWLLEDAAAGGVFAAGHDEAGNDMPLLLSTSRAERVEGGYRFYGRKIFGSLTPVWTKLGIHGMDTSDPENPKVVHAFLERGAEGYRTVETWDTMGMRATRSDDTILEGAFVPDHHISHVAPADPVRAGLFELCVFAWAAASFGSIYVVRAERARDLAVTSVRKKTSVVLSRSMAYHPEIQHSAAAMVIALEGATAHVERIAADWSAGVDHGHGWSSKLVAAKYHAVETAKTVWLGDHTAGGDHTTSSATQGYRTAR